MGNDLESTRVRLTRSELTEAIKAAALSPRVMALPVAIVGAIVVVIIMILLGFRSIRLDDLREQVREIHQQRDLFLQAIAEAKDDRAAMIKAMDSATAERRSAEAHMKGQDELIMKVIGDTGTIRADIIRRLDRLERPAVK